MSFFRKLVATFSQKKKQLSPTQTLTRVDDEFPDLSALSTEELIALEASLTAQAQAQEAKLKILQSEQRAQANSRDFATWVDALRILFGPVLAHKLSLQEIEPGMQIKHLVASFGPADEIKNTENGVRFVYGTEQTGSYFDIQGDTIIRVRILTRPHPPVSRDAQG